MFITHGVPDTLGTDSGPCFVSEDFAPFLCGNGIQYLRTSPYHLASNGLVERAVCTVKSGLAKIGTVLSISG